MGLSLVCLVVLTVWRLPWCSHLVSIEFPFTLKFLFVRLGTADLRMASPVL